MSIDDMRARIVEVYDSDSWHIGVAAMTDEQVTAIYLKFKSQGKFDGAYRPSRGNDKPYISYWNELCRRCAGK